MPQLRWRVICPASKKVKDSTTFTFIIVLPHYFKFFFSAHFTYSCLEINNF